MNHTGLPLHTNLPEPTQTLQEPDDFIDIEQLFGMIARQAKVVAFCAAMGLLLGILYLMTTPPTYIAVGRVLIDERLNKIIDDTSATTSSQLTDSSIESQIEILGSNRLALTVVDSEKLDENTVFLRPSVSTLAKVFGFVRAVVLFFLPSRSAEPGEQSNADTIAQQIRVKQAIRQGAAFMLQKEMVAQRVGRSHVIAIGFRSHNPMLAQQIANAYTKAYVEDQLHASYEATEQAAVWLEGRLADLRESSQSAALAVEKFRRENGLTAARGELLAERQLSDLTTQLIEAKSDTARALARFRQYSSITDAGAESAVQNATMSSDQNIESVVGTLKTSYMNVAKRERDISEQFGVDHPQAVALRKEQQQLAERIFQELKLLAVGYKNEYEVALSRETALQESIAAATGRNSDAREIDVQLRELEQKSTALSVLYNTFLTRFAESSQQSSFPISKVRVISEAGLPRSPASPKTILALGLSLVLGLMVGGGFAALNEFNERFFRTADDVRDRLGAKFLGYLPLTGASGPDESRLANIWSFVARLAAWGRQKKPAPIKVRRTASPMDMPGTVSAETLRNVKLASDVVLQGKSGVIAVVSALPNEGKSTVAASLATLLSANKEKVLLIDGDLRNPGLSRSHTIHVKFDLIKALMKGKPWRSALIFDKRRRFFFLPAIVTGRFSHASELLSSAAMRRFLEEAKTEFSYIIVDLPPLGPVMDAKAFAPLADAMVVVVEWGRTPRKLINSFFLSEPVFANKLLGIVINKVDMSQLYKFGSFGSSEKHFHQYASYYVTLPDQKPG